MKKDLRFICGMILLAVILSVIPFIRSIPSFFKSKEEPVSSDTAPVESMTEEPQTETQQAEETAPETETETEITFDTLGGGYAP